MDWREHIERRPGVMLGKPVFRGTRLTVEFVIERLGQGASVEELVQNYPGLTEERVFAALTYAAAALRHDDLEQPA